MVFYAEKDRLDLGEDLLVGKGQERLCYLHPADPQRIVKVANPACAPGSTANSDEWRAHQLVLRKYKGVQHFLCPVYGFVPTNQGDGLLCQCQRDADGQICKTIWDLVMHEQEPDYDALIATVRHLCDTFLARKVWHFDLNLKNIAIRRSRDGSLSPLVLDLKGLVINRELLPLSSVSAFFARKKFTRRANRLLERLDAFRLKSLQGP